MEPQKVYIDEAGFTGGNLLDRDQSELVFARSPSAKQRPQGFGRR